MNRETQIVWSVSYVICWSCLYLVLRRWLARGSVTVCPSQRRSLLRRLAERRCPYRLLVAWQRSRRRCRAGDAAVRESERGGVEVTCWSCLSEIDT